MNIDESLTAKGFTPGDQVPNRTIEWLTLHHWGALGQTHDGVCAFFCTTGPGATSAHYVVSAGRVNCIVSPGDVAWHAGTWDANCRSVGIEMRPEATEDDYRQVAELVAHLRAQFQNPDLPLRPHRDFYNTACPGVWDLQKVDRMAREIAAGGSPQTTPEAAPVAVQSAPAAPPAAPALAADQCIVDPGDTLSGIAAQYGVDLSELIAINGITEPDKIFPGMVLDLPVKSSGPSQCIVDPGDTLSGIAAQFGTTVDHLLAVNPGINADLIFPGQVLNL
jgi:N-acetylmuramoyl-L-alanine amidase